jgi:hypothetical protein
MPLGRGPSGHSNFSVFATSTVYDSSSPLTLPEGGYYGRQTEKGFEWLNLLLHSPIIYFYVVSCLLVLYLGQL